MTEGRLETESKCRACLAIIKGEVTSNHLSKRRVRTRTHGVVGGRGLVAPLPDFIDKLYIYYVLFAGAAGYSRTYSPLTNISASSILLRYKPSEKLPPE